MDDDAMNPFVQVIGLVGGLAGAVLGTWWAWIAFAGGTMPVLGIESEGGVGMGLFWLLVVDPIVMSAMALATGLLALPFVWAFSGGAGRRPAPAAPAPDANEILPARRRRRWVAPLIIGVALAALTTGGVGAYVDGRRWEDRTEAARARVRSLGAELLATNAEVDSLEDEVGRLEANLRDVRTERDEARDDRDFLGEVAVAAKEVADDLDSCVTATNDFLTYVSTLGPYDDYFTAIRHARAIDDQCSSAQHWNAELNALLGQ